MGLEILLCFVSPMRISKTGGKEPASITTLCAAPSSLDCEWSSERMRGAEKSCGVSPKSCPQSLRSER